MIYDFYCSILFYPKLANNYIMYTTGGVSPCVSLAISVKTGVGENSIKEQINEE